MAIFSFSLKTVSRKAGSGSSRLKAHSAVQSAAYLATTSIKDQRTGEVYNFRHGKKLKDKAESTVDLGIMLPTGDTIQGRGQDCRGVYSDFWSMIEKAERRGDSHVAHAMMGALPAERALGIPDHEIIVETFCREMSRRYRTAIHAAIHYDHRHNPHVHMLMPTRELVDGKPAAKIRVLDNPRTAGAELRKIRELWAECVNRVTAQHGIAPVSPLTLKAQGIDREPGKHKGAYIARIDAELAEIEEAKNHVLGNGKKEGQDPEQRGRQGNRQQAGGEPALVGGDGRGSGGPRSQGIPERAARAGHRGHGLHGPEVERGGDAGFRKQDEGAAIGPRSGEASGQRGIQSGRIPKKDGSANAGVLANPQQHEGRGTIRPEAGKPGDLGNLAETGQARGPSRHRPTAAEANLLGSMEDVAAALEAVKRQRAIQRDINTEDMHYGRQQPAAPAPAGPGPR